jgi:hypothetical protein
VHPRLGMRPVDVWAAVVCAVERPILSGEQTAIQKNSAAASSVWMTIFEVSVRCTGQRSAI